MPPRAVPRPKKKSNAGPVTPAPYYLSVDAVRAETLYCRYCGRVSDSKRVSTVISSRTPGIQDEKAKNLPKYCSERCKRRGRSHDATSVLDDKLDSVFLALLNGAPLPDGIDVTEKVGEEIKSLDRTLKKGESRRLVPCNLVEEIVFGHRSCGEDTDEASPTDSPLEPSRDGHRQGGVSSIPESDSSDEEDEEEEGDRTPVESTADMVRLPQSSRLENGTKIPDSKPSTSTVSTADLDEKRLRGQQIAAEREQVRCAARRACVFGFASTDPNPIGTSTGKSARSKKKKRSGRRKGEDTDGSDAGSGDDGESSIKRRC